MTHPAPTTIDTILVKVFIPLLTAALIAVSGWVWNTSTALTLTQADVTYLRKDIEEAEEDSKVLAGKVDSNKELLIEINRDMKYLKISLSNIEEALEKR